MLYWPLLRGSSRLGACAFSARRSQGKNRAISGLRPWRFRSYCFGGRRLRIGPRSQNRRRAAGRYSGRSRCRSVWAGDQSSTSYRRGGLPCSPGLFSGTRFSRSPTGKLHVEVGNARTDPSVHMLLLLAKSLIFLPYFIGFGLRFSQRSAAAFRSGWRECL
jgi:hypothetical protein